MTVVVVLDCIAAVTAAPAAMPLKGLPVMRLRTWRIFEPANFCSPSLISFIAKRKMASAPAKLRTMQIISQVVIYRKMLFVSY